MSEEDVLTDHWISKGAKTVAEGQLSKTDQALARGSREVAEEHLRKALEALKAYGDHIVSPRLTAGENAEWKRLRNLDWGSMTDTQREDLKRLNVKALGALDKFLKGEVELQFPTE